MNQLTEEFSLFCVVAIQELAGMDSHLKPHSNGCVLQYADFFLDQRFYSFDLKLDVRAWSLKKVCGKEYPFLHILFDRFSLFLTYWQIYYLMIDVFQSILKFTILRSSTPFCVLRFAFCVLRSVFWQCVE